MTFAQAYRELEDKFKQEVDRDKQTHGIESVFLPNVKPTGQVDYVLVGMEPGLNGMDLEIARKKIAVCEFENWGRYPQTNTLVFAVWKYLWRWAIRGSVQVEKQPSVPLVTGLVTASARRACQVHHVRRPRFTTPAWLDLMATPLGTRACRGVEGGLLGGMVWRGHGDAREELAETRF